jgi:hypothetical protein
MSWRVIFVGLICLLLTVVVGTLGFILRDQSPWFPAVSLVADFGIVFGGLKTVLDTTKIANELRKMGFEVEKLRLEIEEKKKAAQKESAYVAVATLEDIKEYTVPPIHKLPGGASPKRSSRSRFSVAAAVTSSALLAVLLVQNYFKSSKNSFPVPTSETSSPHERGDSRAPNERRDDGWWNERENRAQQLEQRQEREGHDVHLLPVPDGLYGTIGLSCKTSRASGAEVGRLVISAAGSQIAFFSESDLPPPPLRLVLSIGMERERIIFRLTSQPENQHLLVANEDRGVHFLSTEVVAAEIQNYDGIPIAFCFP